MINFFHHDNFKKEISKLKGKFHHIEKALDIFERLCNTQFNPLKPQQVIAPAKLHRVTQNNTWTLWKIELVVPGSGLRPNQYPRMWFAVKGDSITFLCIATHTDNFNDKEMNSIALSRVTDFF